MSLALHHDVCRTSANGQIASVVLKGGSSLEALPAVPRAESATQPLEVAAWSEPLTRIFCAGAVILKSLTEGLFHPKPTRQAENKIIPSTF